jgi:hypothetical protein
VLDVTLVARKFRDHAKAHGKEYDDWDSAFKLWIERERAPEAKTKAGSVLSNKSPEQLEDDKRIAKLGEKSAADFKSSPPRKSIADNH